MQEQNIQYTKYSQYSNRLQDIVGQFLYYEGHDYLVYNTYMMYIFILVLHYLQLFPQIELSIQRDFTSAVLYEDNTERICIDEGQKTSRKVKVCNFNYN